VRSQGAPPRTHAAQEAPHEQLHHRAIAMLPVLTSEEVDQGRSSLRSTASSSSSCPSTLLEQLQHSETPAILYSLIVGDTMQPAIVVPTLDDFLAAVGREPTALALGVLKTSAPDSELVQFRYGPRKVWCRLAMGSAVKHPDERLVGRQWRHSFAGNRRSAPSVVSQGSHLPWASSLRQLHCGSCRTRSASQLSPSRRFNPPPRVLRGAAHLVRDLS